MKPFTVQIISYIWDKYSRKLINRPTWRRHRDYQTIDSAKDAIKDFRSQVNIWDYPALGNIENEKKYPNLTPTITIYRYKIIKNKIIKNNT
jgi:hypothetical protein